MSSYRELTFALIFKNEVSGSALEVIVTVFSRNCPACVVLGEKMTSIEPFLPGITGSLEKLGTVQAQDPLAFKIFKGSVPVLVNSNECLFSELTSTLPKFFTSSLKEISGNEFNEGDG